MRPRNRRRETRSRKKRAFWETFWETLEEQQEQGAVHEGGQRRTTTTTETTKETETETVRRETDGTARSDTFWGRCTIGGLALAVLMALSAVRSAQLTARAAACNPLVFFFDPKRSGGGGEVCDV